jgi:isoleucyl-tRNA synthetase
MDFGPLELTRDRVVVRRTEKENLKVLNDGSLTVALDPTITEELKAEGLVRDIIRSVQSLRKNSGLEVTDRIHLYAFGPAEVEEAVNAYLERLLEETLAVSWHWERHADAIDVNCGELSCSVALQKVD